MPHDHWFTPLSDVSARIPLASKIPAYFGFCMIPTHRTREQQL